MLLESIGKRLCCEGQSQPGIRSFGLGSLKSMHPSTYWAPSKTRDPPDFLSASWKLTRDSRTLDARKPLPEPKRPTRRCSEAAPAAESAISHSVPLLMAVPHSKPSRRSHAKAARNPCQARSVRRSPQVGERQEVPIFHPRPTSRSQPLSLDRQGGVRAVFPEPPVRRAPPQRSRPTVSLDDYSNRRNRGRR